MKVSRKTSRRDWLAALAMGAGLVASYGVFALQGVLFLLPPRIGARTRRLYAGRIDQLGAGGVSRLLDLEGNEVLLRRGSDGQFRAFNSTCPHLGCRVHWQEEQQRFFCPCHNGVFDAAGVAISGPPADGGQDLVPVPLDVDEKAGVLYMQVKDRQS